MVYIKEAKWNWRVILLNIHNYWEERWRNVNRIHYNSEQNDRRGTFIWDCWLDNSFQLKGADHIIIHRQSWKVGVEDLNCARGKNVNIFLAYGLLVDRDLTRGRSLVPRAQACKNSFFNNSLRCNRKKTCQLLGTFVKLRKATISSLMLVCPSILPAVSPSVWNN
jgi:hypothetical protein